MKYRVIHFDYHVKRDQSPFMFTVEGEPETLAEMKATGMTVETLTLAEIEARGISLPTALGTANAVAAKRIDELSAQVTEIQNRTEATFAAIRDLLK